MEFPPTHADIAQEEDKEEEGSQDELVSIRNRPRRSKRKPSRRHYIFVRIPNTAPAQTAAMEANADDINVRNTAMAATGTNREGRCVIPRPSPLVQPNRKYSGSNWVNYTKSRANTSSATT